MWRAVRSILAVTLAASLLAEAPLAAAADTTPSVSPAITAAAATGGTSSPPSVAASAVLPTVRAQFDLKKLTIEPRGVDPARPLRLRTTRARFWKKWDAYQGTTRIDEANFFRIAGDERNARTVESFHHMNRVMTGCGLAVLVAGLLVMKSARGGSSGPYSNHPSRTGGAVLSLAGVAMTVSGAMRRDERWAPYTTAADLATRYNTRLGAELGVKF